MIPYDPRFGNRQCCRTLPR